ncbi:MAG: MerR family transcriptional regulator [Actinomycetota bacterium]|nr:MerR family transcriptional regulator [Actinomycetota bacterium]
MATATQLYSYKELADKSGVKAATLRVWHARGKLPPPDFTVGQSPAWLPDTVREWLRAQGVEPQPADPLDLEGLKAKFTGRRVQYIGMRGNADGPLAKVWRVTKSGIWVTMADGSRQQWHAEDITVVKAS